MNKTLDLMLFQTTTKRASELSVGDTLDISPGAMVVAHIETSHSGRTVRGYFHDGRKFQYSSADSVRVQVAS